MVSSTALLPALPACASQDGNSPSSSLDVGRDPENALSFASRLDQRLSRPAPSNNANRPQLRRSDTQPAVQEASSDDDSSTSQPAQTADAASESTNVNAADDNAEGKDKADAAEKPTAAPTPNLTPTPQSTSDALASPAFLAAVANVVPIPAVPVVPSAQPTTATAVTANLAPIVPAVDNNAAAQINNANPALTAQSAANTVPSAPTIPSIIPAVSMDSRVPVFNGTPGVDNAAPIPALLPAATANAAAAASLNIATTAPLPLPSGTNGNSAATLANAAPNSAAPNSITPGTSASTTSAGAASTLQTVTTPSQNSPAVVNPENSLRAALGAAADMATIGTTLPVQNPPANSTPSGVTTSSAVVNPVGTARTGVTATLEPQPAETALQPGTSERANTPAVLPAKQHLDGIERLLTLSNAKSTPSPLGVELGAKADASAATFANGGQNAAALPTSANTALANTTALKPGVPVPASALPSGTSASATPASAVGTTAPQTAVPIVTASTGFDGTSKPSAIAAALHGLTGTSEQDRLSPSSSAGINGGGIGTAGENAALLHAQASAFAGDGSGEQGQEEAQPQSEEQNSASGTGTANTAATGGASAFALARAQDDTTVTAQAATSASSSQAERAHVVEQVTRHLESMRLTNGGGEMRLRLNPHNLGSVQVTITTHQDGVIARIAVESAQVQQAMEHAKADLRASLETRGLRVQSVEVTVSPSLQGDNSAAFSGQRNWQPAQTHDSAQWQPGGYGRRPAPSAEALPAVASAAITPRASLSDARLDCRV